METDDVAHSPTPSIVSTADSSNGEGKKADAACDRWCSVNNRLLWSNPSSKCFSDLTIWSFWNSFSFIQIGIAVRNDVNPFGAKLTYVSSRRSNFRNGLS